MQQVAADPGPGADGGAERPAAGYASEGEDDPVGMVVDECVVAQPQLDGEEEGGEEEEDADVALQAAADAAVDATRRVESYRAWARHSAFTISMHARRPLPSAVATCERSYS